MQQYTRSVQTVEALQTPWPMQITVNGKVIAGNAGEWLVIPSGGKDQFFMSDIDFEAQFTAVVQA